MNDAFAAMIKLQEEALRMQRMGIDAARAWSDAAGSAVQMQRRALDASNATMKMWNAAFDFWGIKR